MDPRDLSFFPKPVPDPQHPGCGFCFTVVTMGTLLACVGRTCATAVTVQVLKRRGCYCWFWGT